MSQPDMFVIVPAAGSNANLGVIEKVTSKGGNATLHVRRGRQRVKFKVCTFAPPVAFKKPIHATHWDYCI